VSGRKLVLIGLGVLIALWTIVGLIRMFSGSESRTDVALVALFPGLYLSLIAALISSPSRAAPPWARAVLGAGTLLISFGGLILLSGGDATLRFLGGVFLLLSIIVVIYISLSESHRKSNGE
jgi:hypothetical protein